jgi:NitT/TauT family transport system substrate-binding protein
MRAKRMWRGLVVMVLLALVAACSGEAADDAADEGADDAAEGAADATPADDEAADDEAADDEAADDGEPDFLRVVPASPSLVSNAYYYLADHLGFYEEEGLEVEVISSFEGSAPEVALLEGELDLAVGDPPILFERILEDPAYPVRVIAVNGLWPFRVLVTSDSELQSAEDLVGTTVGIPEQSDAATLSHMLRVAGVDPESVEMAAVGGRAAAAVELDAGRIAAFMGSHVDQLAMEAEFGEDAFRIIETIPVSSLPNNFLMVAEDRLAEDPEVFERFLRALAKAFVIQVEDPELAVALIGQARPEAYEDADDALALMMATNEVNGATLDVEWAVPPEEWQTAADGFTETGTISGEVDVAPFIDNSLLEAAWDFDRDEVLAAAAEQADG